MPDQKQLCAASFVATKSIPTIPCLLALLATELHHNLSSSALGWLHVICNNLCLLMQALCVLFDFLKLRVPHGGAGACCLWNKKTPFEMYVSMCSTTSHHALCRSQEFSAQSCALVLLTGGCHGSAHDRWLSCASRLLPWGCRAGCRSLLNIFLLPLSTDSVKARSPLHDPACCSLVWLVQGDTSDGRRVEV